MKLLILSIILAFILTRVASEALPNPALAPGMNPINNLPAGTNKFGANPINNLPVGGEPPKQTLKGSPPPVHTKIDKRPPPGHKVPHDDPSPTKKKPPPATPEPTLLDIDSDDDCD